MGKRMKTLYLEDETADFLEKNGKPSEYVNALIQRDMGTNSIDLEMIEYETKRQEQTREDARIKQAQKDERIMKMKYMVDALNDDELEKIRAAIFTPDLYTDKQIEALKRPTAYNYGVWYERGKELGIIK